MPFADELAASCSDVPGWSVFSDGASIGWHASASTLQVGVTHVFEATVRLVKSSDLLGSPKFKPQVIINYGTAVSLPSVTGLAAFMNSADGTVSARFSSPAPLLWQRVVEAGRSDFTMNSALSRVTAPPPPLRVIVPASVRIAPDTLKLNRPGVLTAFLTLDPLYDVNSVDVSTVRCRGAAALSAIDAAGTLVLKFNVADLVGVVPAEEATVVVSGALFDGSVFRATATVRAIEVP